MILLIDNYDSFTYNIYQYLLKLGEKVQVFRNDKITIDEISKMNPDHIIISPGPGNPDTAGISVEVVKTFSGQIPILGICLGHQCIGQAFGGEIVKASRIFHGKTSEINHDGRGVFTGVKDPFTAIRYHSLVIKRLTLPEVLEVTATVDSEIMGVRHKLYSVEGIQFHPESIGSSYGYDILRNFLTDETKENVMKTAIKKVFKGQDLSESEAEMVMEEITSGDATHAQIAAILTTMSLKKESVSELTGFVRVMRRKATKIKKPDNIKAVDTCGTGGDGSNTFNISTICAFVTAGAGITVAKHGNRSVTSRCGSADLLEVLGINILRSPEVMIKCLEEIGIAFLFAPRLHMSMKHAVPVRKEL
ncbi:anthranilate phosphoribosyltransferase, partial [bacterium]|nr:anthranilate phosphoribosyltransferase [bacterium]